MKGTYRGLYEVPKCEIIKVAKEEVKGVTCKRVPNIVSEENVDRVKFKHAQLQLQRDPYSIKCQQRELIVSEVKNFIISG